MHYWFDVQLDQKLLGWSLLYKVRTINSELNGASEASEASDISQNMGKEFSKASFFFHFILKFDRGLRGLSRTIHLKIDGSHTYPAFSTIGDHL